MISNAGQWCTRFALGCELQKVWLREGSLSGVGGEGMGLLQISPVMATCATCHATVLAGLAYLQERLPTWNPPGFLLLSCCC